MNPSSKPTIGRAALFGNLALISLLWGSSFILLKALSATFPPFTVAALRAGAATLAIVLMFLATGRRLLPTRDDLVAAAVMGTLHGFLPNALVAYGVTGLGAGLAAMVQSATPLVTALLAAFFLPGDRLSPRQMAGVLLGFAGVGLVIGPEAIGGPAAALWPALAMLATTVSYAIGNIWVRRAPPIPPERIALGQQTGGFLGATVLSLVFEPWSGWTQAPAYWFEILIFGAVMSALPFTLFVRLIQRAGPVRATVVGYLVPIVATALAIALLGETIALRQIAGAAVVIAGVVLVTRR
ncbi:MAG: DMT family transporter [Methylobacteriaceae bacterium]|nr:DMT family transporter [Methylobacteriaceae bacterium]